MTAFATSTAAPGTGGLPYATAAALPSTEADIFNQLIPPFFDPVPVPSEHEALFAIVQIAIPNALTTNAAYIVLQTDLGDGVWVDVAWIVYSGISGTATFSIAAGAGGSQGVQQTRAANTAPASSSVANLPLGGRIRFVGKAAITSPPDPAPTSSSSSVTIYQVLVTIKYLFLKVWGK